MVISDLLECLDLVFVNLCSLPVKSKCLLFYALPRIDLSCTFAGNFVDDSRSNDGSVKRNKVVMALTGHEDQDLRTFRHSLERSFIAYP